jgi:hypothetical protein
LSALTELIKPLPNCPGLSESQQFDFIERIDTPELPPNDLRKLEGDPFILLRNIHTHSGLAKGRRCRVVEMRNRTVVVQLDDNETRALTRIPMEKTSNGMQFVRWQFPLRRVFAGTVHRSQGMTLDRAVIDRRTTFWEHGQFYAALSRVKTPADLCILQPSDMEDFMIRPPVDLEVVHIIETVNSSGESAIPFLLPEDHFDGVLCSLDSSEATSSDALPRPDDYFQSSDDELDSSAMFDDDSIEIVDQ